MDYFAWYARKLNALNAQGNKISLMIKNTLPLLTLFFTVYSSTCLSVLLPHNNNHNNNIISLHEWKTINVVYYHDIKVNNIDININKKYSSCISLSHHTNILRCREYAKLMRPENTVRTWLEQQKRRGYFVFKIKEFNIKNIHGHIISVNSIKRFIPYKHNSHKNLVTGLFIRYNNRVRTYKFKSTKTNKVSKINATPNHTFYVINKRAFIPVSKITSKDILINDKGEKIKLLCLKDQFKNCGIKYGREQLMPVYNLEIYNSHSYFVGKNRILVHNGCLDKIVEKLKKILDGAGENHEQAIKELQNIQYTVLEARKNYSWTTSYIGCQASYRLPAGGAPVSEVYMEFYEKEWHIGYFYLDKDQAFSMNDMIRHAYFKTLEHADFDISHPKKISVRSIGNPDTLNIMAELSSNLPWLEQLPIFYGTPVGKTMERFFSDFNFRVVAIDNMHALSSRYLLNGKFGVAPTFTFSIKQT